MTNLNKDKLREEFERAFNSKHGSGHHALAGDGKKSRDCEVCQEDRRVNPKGYYLTYLSEKRHYWNRDMMNDVANFWLAKISQAKLETLEAIIKEVGGLPTTTKRKRNYDTRPLTVFTENLINKDDLLTKLQAELTLLKNER